MEDTRTATASPHYLAHLAKAAALQQVSVTEDILASNGTKLVAKGSRIDAGVCDRLLRHVLHKPLEDCVQVADGVTAAGLQPIGQTLLERYRFLAVLVQDSRERPAPAALADLKLTPAVLSLLTVYGLAGPQRLEHATGVAILAFALARKLFPGEPGRHRTLAVAGLLHDIGELYIDPSFMRDEVVLKEEQWRHIVTHPVVASHVLRKLDGAGPAVAAAVLLHHERLDGFGYPAGVSGSAFTLNGQVLAAAEWLMGLMEHGASPITHAHMATRLVPCEFSPALLDLVCAAARQAPDEPVRLAELPPLEQALPRIRSLARVLARFRAMRSEIDACDLRAAPALRAVLQAGQQRMLRIHASFTSAGLDTDDPAAAVVGVATGSGPAAYMELMALVRELEWRVREFERTLRLRSFMLGPADRVIATRSLAFLVHKTEPTPVPEPVPAFEGMAERG